MRRIKAPIQNSQRHRRFVWNPSGSFEVISETTRTPIPWIGGKNYLARWIIEHFPAHACYVEPFGGGASVLLQKRPSHVEVFNDIDGHIVEFFEVVKKNPWQLIAILEHMPNSRLLFEGMTKMARHGTWPRNKVERVAFWLYQTISNFAGKPLSGWRHGRYTPNHRLSSLPSSLVEVSNRLQGVQLECSDFRKIIATYDSVGTLFYCDPPYIGVEHYYAAGGFSMQNHVDLAKLLHRIKGKVCLSYGVHPNVDELYAGWRTEQKIVPVHSFGITATTSAKNRKHKPKRVELLLMNF